MLPIIPALALQADRPQLVVPSRPPLVLPTARERAAFDPALGMLPFASPLLLQGAAAGGGGGGSMGAGPTLRGQAITAFTSGNPIFITLPSGSQVGDLAICYGSSIQGIAGYASGQTQENGGTLSGTGLTSVVYWKRLDQTDITNNYLHCAYGGADNAILGIIVLPNTGTVGSEAISGVPTSYSGVTWSGSGATGTATCAGASQIVRWAGLLTTGQTYRMQFDYNKTSGAQIRVSNGASNGSSVSWTSATLANGSGTITAYFTALDTYFALEASAAVYSGTISNISVKPASALTPNVRTGKVAGVIDGLTTAASLSVNANVAAQAGDYAIIFGSTKSNMAVAISGAPGSAVHSLSDAKGSGVARIGTLLTAGTFAQTIDYSGGSPSGEFATIILVQP